MRATKRALALTVLGVVLIAAPATLGAQEAARPLPNPTTRDMFRLDDLESYKQFSQVKNFEIVGHSYFRGPWVVPGGAGTGINTLRICGTIAYLAGYNPTVFGALIVDVANPAAMEPLSFIPGNPGTPICAWTARGRSSRSATARAPRTRTKPWAALRRPASRCTTCRTRASP